MSCEIMQYGSATDNACISLTLLAETKATRSAVFSVSSLMEQVSRGSNGSLQNLFRTMDKSQDGNLVELGIRFRPIDVRNLLIKGSSAILKLRKFESAATWTFSVLSARPLSAPSCKKSRIAGTIGPSIFVWLIRQLQNTLQILL